ncbi:MAG: type II toxin-antitoxin system RelE/ParE family toxin [Flavobacteriales bacterium]|nr:type II toxin-antitoxin system RelE/ParE family toxin [Flavobacteriales bacterium]
MAEVIWMPGALEDIDAIASYIALDSTVRARQQVLRILSAEELLVPYPGGGHMVPEMRSRVYREVIIPPYRIIYHYVPKGGVVSILAVIHSKQQVRSRAVRKRRPGL